MAFSANKVPPSSLSYAHATGIFHKKETFNRYCPLGLCALRKARKEIYAAEQFYIITNKSPPIIMKSPSSRRVRLFVTLGFRQIYERRDKARRS
jgi:hypothetical protein